MRFWFFAHGGEQLPVVDEGQRPLRLCMIARELVRKGHEVTWWTSAFEHVKKIHRVRKFKGVDAYPGLTINLVPGLGYPRNVSYARVRHNRLLARDILNVARTESEPALVLAPLPAPVISAAAVAYGKKHEVPVVVDIRDLWPDAIVELFPRITQPFLRIMLSSMARDTRASCSESTCMTAVTEDYLDWGLGQAHRPKMEQDRVFRLAYPGGETLRDLSQSVYRELPGVTPADLDGKFVVTFIGTLGASIQFDTVIAAARLLKESHPSVVILVCGGGPLLEKSRVQAEDLANLKWSGRVGADGVRAALKVSDVGLVPYRSTFNLVRNVPNKIGEYLSAGLPMISCLKGRVAELLSREEVGLTFDENDPADLASRIAHLQSDPQLCRQMQDSARKLFKREFMGENVYADFADHLISLAGNG